MKLASRITALVLFASASFAQVAPPNDVTMSSVAVPLSPSNAANPTATISSTVGTFVNGSATTYMRSDAAPTLPASISGLNSVTSNTTTALSMLAGTPAQVASSTAGLGVAITASNATAGSTNAGAAAGGAVTITGGSAAQKTSGSAVGGNITLTPGSGIGGGAGGSVVITGGNLTAASGNMTLSTQAGNSNLDLQSSGSGRVRTNANLQVLGGIIYPSNGNGQIQNSSNGVFLLANNNNDGFSTLNLGPAGGATCVSSIQKSVTGIADGVATNVLTVTIPNAAHSARLHVELAGSLGAGGAIGANEATGVISYDFAIARTAGVATVTTASTAYGSATAAVAGAATITITAAASGMTGTVSATQTFTVQVTISHGSGSSTNHTCQVRAEVLNANASGITIS